MVSLLAWAATAVQEVRHSPVAKLAFAGVLLVGPTLCNFLTGSSGSNGTQAPLGTTNIYWNCPSPSPQPTASPIPTICVVVTTTPDVNGQGGGVKQEECNPPAPTATPLPTGTPYGRQVLPQGRQASQNLFYGGQDVRVGEFRMTFLGISKEMTLGDGRNIWKYSFDGKNEGARPTLVWWQLQTAIREVRQADGTVVQGVWRAEDEAALKIGLPRFRAADTQYAVGQQRHIELAVTLPPGQPQGVVFLPEIGLGDRSVDFNNSANAFWFIPGRDPYCSGNTSGPVTGPAQGGAVYQQPLPPTLAANGQGGSKTGASFANWKGWPVQNGGSVITQQFGCTDFTELSGFDCPDSRPYYHSGIDFGKPKGSEIYSIVYGTVLFIGDSRNPGSRSCAGWAGSEAPHYNLGWAVYIHPDNTPDGFMLRYGHTAIDIPSPVREGERVVPGQVIAYVGSTGCSTGNHLHFMLQQGGVFLDPLNYIGRDRADRP